MTDQPDHAAPDITWQDPPPPSTTGRKPNAKYDALRQHPGRWALWGSYAHTSSASTAAARLGRLGFEATTRGGDVYARWPEQSA